MSIYLETTFFFTGTFTPPPPDTYFITLRAITFDDTLTAVSVNHAPSTRNVIEVLLNSRKRALTACCCSTLLTL